MNGAIVKDVVGEREKRREPRLKTFRPHLTADLAVIFWGAASRLSRSWLASYSSERYLDSYNWNGAEEGTGHVNRFNYHRTAFTAPFRGTGSFCRQGFFIGLIVVLLLALVGGFGLYGRYT